MIDYSQFTGAQRKDELEKQLLAAEKDYHRLFIDKVSMERVLNSQYADARDKAAIRLIQVLSDLDVVKARIDSLNSLLADAGGEH